MPARCLLELWTAISSDVPIVAILVKGGQYSSYDFEDASYFLRNFEVELARRNPGAPALIRNHGVELAGSRVD